MSKSAKTPIVIKHRMRVNKLKAQLPEGWFTILQDRMNRGSTFVSNMINKYEDWREEWKIVEELVAQHEASLQDSKREIAQTP